MCESGGREGDGGRRGGREKRQELVPDGGNRPTEFRYE
jgi:hypothetical protein